MISCFHATYIHVYFNRFRNDSLPNKIDLNIIVSWFPDDHVYKWVVYSPKQKIWFTCICVHFTRHGIYLPSYNSYNNETKRYKIYSLIFTRFRLFIYVSYEVFVVQNKEIIKTSLFYVACIISSYKCYYQNENILGDRIINIWRMSQNIKRVWEYLRVGCTRTKHKN